MVRCTAHHLTLDCKNEMNLCVHVGYTGPGEPPEDGEMNEMTLSSRHRIRNSSPGGLRPSTLPLGHGGSPQYLLLHVDGEETFLFLSKRRDRKPNNYPRAPAQHWTAVKWNHNIAERDN